MRVETKVQGIPVRLEFEHEKGLWIRRAWMRPEWKNPEDKKLVGLLKKMQQTAEEQNAPLTSDVLLLVASRLGELGLKKGPILSRERTIARILVPPFSTPGRPTSVR